jgi:hypothetical protein
MNILTKREREIRESVSSRHRMNMRDPYCVPLSEGKIRGRRCDHSAINIAESTNEVL